jgi:hypothetical protein
MAGEDSIIAVSKMFAELADEAGAAADSLGTINSILRTSLNRSMLAFGRSIQQSTKLLNNFNQTLKSSVKNVGQNAQLRQTQRYSATFQAGESVHKTKAYVQDKVYANSAKVGNELRNSFADLIDAINNPLIVGIQKTSSELGKLITLISSLSATITSLKAFQVSKEAGTKQLNQFKEYIKSFADKTKGQDVILEHKSPTGKKTDAMVGNTAFEFKTTPKPEPIKFNKATLGDLPQVLKQAGSKVSGATQGLVKGLLGLKLSAVAATAGLALFVAALAKTSYDIVGIIPKTLGKLDSAVTFVSKNIINQFSSVFGKLTGFVSALNPSYGIEAELALKQLSATIGKLLLPVFQVMLGTIKAFTAILNAAMPVLKPVFDQFAKFLKDVAINALASFVKILIAAQPVFNAAIMMFQKLTPIVGGLFDKISQVLINNLPIIEKAFGMLADYLGRYLEYEIQNTAASLANMNRQMEIDSIKLKLFGESAFGVAEMFNWLYNAGVAVIQFIDLGFTIAIQGIVQVFWWFVDPINLLGKIIYSIWDMASKIPVLGKYFGEPAEGMKEWGWTPVAFGTEEERANKAAARQQGGAAAGAAGGGANWWQNLFGGAGGGMQGPPGATGASFQEIGELGKNLQAASFGAGPDTGQQTVNWLEIIAGVLGQMNQNQQQFNGAVPVQGVR